jgi:hypothetical protein
MSNSGAKRLIWKALKLNKATSMEIKSSDIKRVIKIVRHIISWEIEALMRSKSQNIRMYTSRISVMSNLAAMIVWSPRNVYIFNYKNSSLHTSTHWNSLPFSDFLCLKSWSYSITNATEEMSCYVFEVQTFSCVLCIWETTAVAVILCRHL